MLNEVAYLLKENSNATIVLDGHTDTSGDDAFNEKLSKQRAESIKRYIQSKGIDSSRIVVGSFGESKPKFSNKTSGGRALNRRVEMLIKY